MEVKNFYGEDYNTPNNDPIFQYLQSSRVDSGSHEEDNKSIFGEDDEVDVFNELSQPKTVTSLESKSANSPKLGKSSNNILNNTSPSFVIKSKKDLSTATLGRSALVTNSLSSERERERERDRTHRHTISLVTSPSPSLADNDQKVDRILRDLELEKQRKQQVDQILRRVSSFKSVKN